MPGLATVGEIHRRGNDDFDWKVENFLSLSDEPKIYYYSPEFKYKGYSCRAMLFPAGDSDSGGDHVSLNLRMIRSQDGSSVCSTGIKTARGETVVLSSHKMLGQPMVHIFDNSRWILRAELLRRGDGLMPLGDLTIAVSFKVIRDPDVLSFKDASVQTAVGENSADASVQTVEDDGEDGLVEKAGVEKVLHDIGKLWISGDGSDVVMKVRGVEFKAHRAFLTIRAPVLGAMFQHDTTEKASGEVIIDDCEPAVFEQLLHYIYTGAPRELTAENATALYVVADKYLVNEVKALCLQCMKDTICVDNYCDVVTLSLLRNEEELLSVAICFLSEHMVDVMETVEWQVFSREHSTWANEILIRAVKFQAENLRAKRDPSGV